MMFKAHSVLWVSPTKTKNTKGFVNLLIYLSKVLIGDLESVEKITPQQHPLGVNS